jgi:hypothetical protein
MRVWRSHGDAARVLLAVVAVSGTAAASGDIGKWTLSSSVSTESPTPSVTAALRGDGGAEPPTLLIHCRAKQLQAAIVVEPLPAGMTLVTLRLPDTAPEATAWPRTADGRAVVYPGDAAALVERLRAHDSAEVLVTAGATMRTVRFDLRGLDGVLPSLHQACNGKAP